MNKQGYIPYLYIKSHDRIFPPGSLKPCNCGLQFCNAELGVAVQVALPDDALEARVFAGVEALVVAADYCWLDGDSLAYEHFQLYLVCDHHCLLRIPSQHCYLAYCKSLNQLYLRAHSSRCLIACCRALVTMGRRHELGRSSF